MLDLELDEKTEYGPRLGCPDAECGFERLVREATGELTADVSP